MSLLHARALSLRYGAKVLLQDASFALGHHDRVGLIGPNGSGKSTLMKILAGAIEPDGGSVQLVRRARAGYLPQELSELPPGSAIEGVLASVPGRTWLQSRIAAAEAALSQAASEEEQVELGGELAELHEELAHHEELYGRHRAEEILSGLGFAASGYARPASELSGGWKMRAALAALLLQDPELLLLDEPTNHLDVPTLEWFDAFLRRSRKALLLVSHDREFLDRQIDRVLSFEPGGAAQLRGELRALSRAAGRGGGAPRRPGGEAGAETRADESLHRALPRQGDEGAPGAEPGQAAGEGGDRPGARGARHGALPLSRGAAQRSRRGPAGGRLQVVRGAHHLSRSVRAGAARRPHRRDRVERRRQDHAAQVAGGGDRARCRCGAARPQRGDRLLCAAPSERLDPGRTVLEEVHGLVPAQPQSWVRGVLGSFLFSGDDVDKRIGVLSGGERARVALARACWWFPRTSS